MGRYYYGDINGKFWFGVQSSTDASNFGGEAEELYCWSCCRMQGDLTAEDLGKLNECPNECYLDDDNTNTCEVLTDENYVRFTFDKDDIEFVEHIMLDLADKLKVSRNVLNNIMNLETIETEEITDYCDRCADIIYAEYEKDTDRHKEEVEVLWARLYLGIKIYMCLKMTGSCGFDAEL